MKRLGSCLTIACALAAALMPALARADPYVALGDSYTAAPLVPDQIPDPPGCGRSTRNYPSVVRAQLGIRTFIDRSCSSATTRHMTEPQKVLFEGTNPPQFNALRPDAKLVTIGIGGNDVGLVSAAVKCAQLGLLDGAGTACRSHYAKPGGGDRLAEQIEASAPKIAATMQAIHARAPQARVLAVGYPDVAPTDGTSCWPTVPLSADDLAYLDEMLRRTNAMIEAQAQVNDVEYVDTYDDSVGHDVCTPPGRRWFEGLVPTMPAYPIHPNVLGELSMARSVLRVLAGPRPGPVVGPLKRQRRHIRPGRAFRVRFSLNRAAQVSFGLQRSRGRGRYTRRRTVRTVGLEAGRSGVTLSSRRIGRRAGLYRVTVRPAGGRARVVHFRITRRPR